MSLLTICQDAAVEIGVGGSLTTIVGNPDVNAQRLLRFANRIGRDLATRAPWQNLRVQRQFIALNAPEQPGLPEGFQRFIPETMWNLTMGSLIVGPVGPVQWQTLDVGRDYLVTSNGPGFFTRRGNSLVMFPTPIGGETIQFEYQSSYFCQSASGTPQAQWLADSDTARISEELITLGVIAHFLEADGQPAQMARASYERRLGQECRNDAPNARVLGAGDIFGGQRHFSGVPGDRVSFMDSATWGTWSEVWGGA